MSAHAMAELVRCATVRIERADGVHRGTGFFAAPGLVLTAGHVVAPFTAEQLSVVFDGVRLPCTARHLLVEPIPGEKSYPWPDAAILEVDRQDHPCVRLAAAWPNELSPEPLYAYAYAAHYDSATVGGTSVRVTYAGPTEPEPGTRLLRLTWDRIIGGMSGAPLLDPATLEVCAIMKSTGVAPTVPEGYATAIADVLAFAHPAVDQLKAGQEAYRAAAGLGGAEARARWGDLPARAAKLISRTNCAEALAEELVRRQVDLPPGADLAQRLFDTDVRTVGLVLSALVTDKALTREDAVELFETVACCVPVDRAKGLAWWIPPDAAEQLFREISADDPRIAHVVTDQRHTLRMLVRRASGRAPLRLVESDPHGALTPDDSWFAAVESVIREAVPGVNQGWWENPDVREFVLNWVRDDGLVLSFPPIDLTPDELDDLHAKLGPFPFVRSGRAWEPAPSPRVVRIEPAIDAGEETLALLPYSVLSNL